MITMPYDRFDMISAGSLDNSGDLFEEDKSCLSNNKLFSIESFFTGASPDTREKQEESTLDFTQGLFLIISSHCIWLWFNF